jgi:carboxypeptidase family protein
MEDSVRTLISALVVLAAVLILPRAAFAQATIAGVVRDSSGAILPGITVEASSPALTEKTRSVVTDGTGQYRIVTLPPGTYVVKFSLGGFTTVRSATR